MVSRTPIIIYRPTEPGEGKDQDQVLSHRCRLSIPILAGSPSRYHAANRVIASAPKRTFSLPVIGGG